MTKKVLRKKYLEKRKQLNREEIILRSQQIAKHFFASELIENQTFHIYISIEKFAEIDTGFIISELWKRGKTVVIPKMEGKKLISCLYTSETEMKLNNWGISEPAECIQIADEKIDVVLVPMLICDKRGNRIGYGGGFYDRFLTGVRNDCRLIGINFFEPAGNIPAEEFDIPLHALITPEGIIRFNIHL